jgi:hypothetical protein
MLWLGVLNWTHWSRDATPSKKGGKRRVIPRHLIHRYIPLWRFEEPDAKFSNETNFIS